LPGTRFLSVSFEAVSLTGTKRTSNWVFVCAGRIDALSAAVQNAVDLFKTRNLDQTPASRQGFLFG
jgi:hypothetical protein